MNANQFIITPSGSQKMDAVVVVLSHVEGDFWDIYKTNNSATKTGFELVDFLDNRDMVDLIQPTYFA